MTRSATLVRPGQPGTETRKPQVGDLRWDGERWRRWSGRRWTAAPYSRRPADLRRPDRFDQEPALTEQVRAETLERAIEDQVIEYGARVVHRGPTGVVLGYRKPVSHVAHAVVSLITGGLWAVVWICMSAARSEDRRHLACDPWGHVWMTGASGR